MSTALEAASLVMVPSGYEDGSLASVKPTDGSGDFTFTRGSNISATRVNEQGYIEKGYDNLLLQSNSFLTTWSQFNANPPVSGYEGYDGTNDAWLISKTGANGRIQQLISKSGVNAFSVYAKRADSDYILLQLVGGVSPNAKFNLITGEEISSFGEISVFSESIGNGWFRFTIIGGNALSLVRIYPTEETNNDATSGSIYIQDAMLNQGLVAYPYVETTTAPVAGGILEDMPRLDYTDSSCPALLLEPQRTNLLRNSEALNISPNVVESVSYSYNEIASPSGFINAPKFSETPDATSYRHGFYHYVSIPNGAITASIFTKQIDRRYVSLQSNATGSNQYSYVDLEDGSVVSEGTGWTLSTEDYGNGWWRIIATATGIQGSPYFIWGMSLNGTSNTYSGDGSEFTFWGGQIEAGSYPTSYIPTYGTSQTRLNDYFKVINQEGLFGTNEGTFFVEFAFDINNKYIAIGDTYPSDKITIGLNASGSSQIRSIIRNNGSSINLQGSGTTLGDTIKACVSYGSSGFKLFMNGSLEDSDATAANLSQFSDLIPNVDLRDVNSSNSGTIKQILLFPTALSDDECIELTTI